MPRSGGSRPVLATLAALVVAALCATGCVSMPSGGPVYSYPVTQGPDAQNQPYVQIVPQPPGAGWSPSQIVQGFLSASASFGNYGRVALQYLTPAEQKNWKPRWSALVYKNGPEVRGAVYPVPAAKNPTTATVQIAGTIQANLQGYGSYSVPSAATPDESLFAQPSFTLVKVGGQWRISSAPPEYLLTSDSFANDYQLRNLYFFDPMTRSLVPDPVYVPLRATPGDLMNGLVHDLVSPPDDWLSAGATRTAFPSGTQISDVAVDGVTAVVNLSGTVAKAGNAVLQQISAQLLWTLSGAAQSGSTGQTVQSVEVELNGKPWVPPGSQGNPVQRDSSKVPADGAAPAFYYVDSAGYLTSRDGIQGKSTRIARIGTGFAQIAVSPDGRYLAALSASDTLYTGLIGHALSKRGTGFQDMSWDVNDNLWASQGTQIVMFRGVSIRQPLGQMVVVDVVSSAGFKNMSVPFTALRVAPDGVRVAIVIANAELTFGAISGQLGPSPQITLSPVQMGPVNATAFTGLTWYGPDNVITLAGPGPAVTEYPVSGGTPTPVPVDSNLQTITASAGNLLIGELPGDRMVADASLTGSWTPVPVSGSAPAYPG